MKSETRSLLDRPQPLGFLPTYWFWNDPETSRLAGWIMGPVAGLTVLLVLAASPHPLVGGLIAMAVITLANGLLEKYVRHEAQKRRALAAASVDELQPARSEER